MPWNVPETQLIVHPASPSVTFGILPLHKRKGILWLPGAFRGAFQKNDTCFPLFCCVCDLWASVILVRRNGCRGGSQGTPRCSWTSLPKNYTLKMILGRARAQLLKLLNGRSQTQIETLFHSHESADIATLTKWALSQRRRRTASWDL